MQSLSPICALPAANLQPGSKHIESTDEFLTLEGLRLIWDKNQITETAKKLEPKAAR